jgi:hypothetical protein
MRETVEVVFGDASRVLMNGECKAHLEAMAKTKFELGLPDTWKIACVRVDEHQIAIIYQDGLEMSWFMEKECPPITSTGDRVRDAAARVPPGTWNVTKPVAACAWLLPICPLGFLSSCSVDLFVVFP